MGAEPSQRGGRIRALLLDAMGTLLTFEPPAPHLRAALRERLGAEVGEDAARRGDRGRDRLLPRAPARGPRRGRAWRRCGGRPQRRCAPPLGLADADGELLTAALLDALRFRAFPEVPARCGRCGRAGLRLVVVSNWDVSLHERLEETGLAALRRRRGGVRRDRLGQARPGDLRARARARGRGARRRRGTSATRRARTSRARGRRGSRRCCWRATAAAGAPRPACGRSRRWPARRAPRTLGSRVTSAAPPFEPTAAVPGSRPRRRPPPPPSRRDGLPAWPAWAPFAAMLITLSCDRLRRLGDRLRRHAGRRRRVRKRPAARRPDRRHVRPGPRC